jgi:DNA mismatch repair protein MutS
LAERRATFIFATHLHEIAQLPVIQAISNLRIAHLQVMYDEETKLLLYDRRLKDGSGDTLYGLEVCKSLDMPPHFLHLANTIRQSYLEMSPTVVSQKPSRYSQRVFVDVCSVCHKPAKEVHHIQEQHKADAEGYIGHMHKNSDHNLMQVCEACHDAIHHQQIEVKGYVMTEKGRKLRVTKPRSKPIST